jgi:hypothetical protein
MDPNTLRGLVGDAVEEYIDADQWELEQRIERGEKRDLFAMLHTSGPEA